MSGIGESAHGLGGEELQTLFPVELDECGSKVDVEREWLVGGRLRGGWLRSGSF
jgi:hypothetical protein